MTIRTVVNVALVAIGVAAVLLGGLWLLQGLGLMRIEPILCVSNCEVMEGPSANWAAAGFGLLAAGVVAVAFAVRRRARPP